MIGIFWGILSTRRLTLWNGGYYSKLKKIAVCSDTEKTACTENALFVRSRDFARAIMLYYFWAGWTNRTMANRWEGSSKPTILNITVPEVKKIKQPTKYYVRNMLYICCMLQRAQTAGFHQQLLSGANKANYLISFMLFIIFTSFLFTCRFTNYSLSGRTDTRRRSIVDTASFSIFRSIYC